MHTGKIKVILFCILVAFIILSAKSYAYTEDVPMQPKSEFLDEKTCGGIYVDDIYIGSMTKEEAAKVLQDHLSHLQEKKVILTVGGTEIVGTLEDLGYTMPIGDYIDEAMEVGRSGNLIERYKDIKDAKENKYKISPRYAVHRQKLDDFIKRAEQLTTPPVNASMKKEDGKFTYVKDLPGKTVDISATKDALIGRLFHDWDRADIAIEVATHITPASYTVETLKGSSDLLGTATSYYNTGNTNRAANISHGANLINNALIYPGEEFSSLDFLGPLTKENGYYTASAYMSGTVVDSYGGGLCQLATTLYHALLYSELEITERHPHSMTVSYTELGMDAAIAEHYKDLKFKNNTDFPVLVEAQGDGGVITFNIWGNNTRDKGRTFKFRTLLIEELLPPIDVITVDESKPTTYRNVTQSAKTGYTIRLYKDIYMNGKKEREVLIETSRYEATPRYVTIGGKEQ